MVEEFLGVRKGERIAPQRVGIRAVCGHSPVLRLPHDETHICAAPAGNNGAKHPRSAGFKTSPKGETLLSMLRSLKLLYQHVLFMHASQDMTGGERRRPRRQPLRT